jgi:FHS family L-fucose permease-like MFS transporter
LVFLNGKVADHYGINWAFLITALCELYVLGYALWGSRPTTSLPPEQLSVESAG